ncbi:PadR family transcriptional regulator [Bacillus sp. es.036]|uniref:PadR family transcriptional regulator n=1 Tax=Bacillus sp. es.036 TaxID=1761764 RepID=UPI000BF8D1B2|nr:PadR family transcriptional regulator [Bacillus sp. es.036]PFG14433.1 PadR family transcriptional regulator [Bacillus sp. es.036]
MSIQIVILGLLNKEPYHPYEMKKVIIEKKWDQLFSVTDGNLYHAIRKLKANKWIEEQKTEEVNNRPSRTVYRITQEGTNHLASSIGEVFQQKSMDPGSLYPALLFIHPSHLIEMKPLIIDWITDLDNKSESEMKYDMQIPNLIHKHYKSINIAHKNFLQEVINHIESLIAHANEDD